MISQAIEEGINDGMYRAFAEHIEESGDCYDEPQDRCVMRPDDGCACLFARWERLPWYRRAFNKRPKKPDLACVRSAALDLLITEAVFDARISLQKRAAQ